MSKLILTFAAAAGLLLAAGCASTRSTGETHRVCAKRVSSYSRGAAYAAVASNLRRERWSTPALLRISCWKTRIHGGRKRGL